MENSPKHIESGEIDLIELFQYIWSKRKFVFKLTSLFLVMGLVVAFTSKKEYQATCRLMPEMEKKGSKLGNLGGLASLAGVNLGSVGNSENGLPPSLYPEVVKSTPFIWKLINTPIYFERFDTTISSYNFFKEIDKPSLFSTILSYTIGLPSKFLSSKEKSEKSKLENYNMVRFSKQDWGFIESYRSRIKIEVDKKTSTINVLTEIPDPVAAASITKLVVDELTEKVVEYKTSKQKRNLDFINSRFKEAKEDYLSKQRRLAIYSDRNRNITTSLVRTEYQRLQNEMNISYEVYKGLASQLEQTKIKVKEETPIFTVLEEVRIPEKKIKPKRGIIILVSIFLGLFFSICLSVAKFLMRDKNLFK